MARSISSSHTLDQNSMPCRATSSMSLFMASIVICRVKNGQKKKIFSNLFLLNSSQCVGGQEEILDCLKSELLSLKIPNDLIFSLFYHFKPPEKLDFSSRFFTILSSQTLRKAEVFCPIWNLKAGKAAGVFRDFAELEIPK